MDGWQFEYKCNHLPCLHAGWMDGNLNISVTISLSSCRLDNLIYSPDEDKVLAVLDWELSTLGDPVSDLAYVCMPFHMEPDQPHFKGHHLLHKK